MLTKKGTTGMAGTASQIAKDANPFIGVDCMSKGTNNMYHKKKKFTPTLTL